MEADNRMRDNTGSSIDDRNRFERKRIRTRSGCQNCRRKKRKCDESKPACIRCKRSDERCEWGLRLAFRPENTKTTTDEHLSVGRRPPSTRCRQFTIMDITPEVIRDYHQFSPPATLREAPSHHERPLDRGMAATSSQISNPDDSFDSPAAIEGSPGHDDSGSFNRDSILRATQRQSALTPSTTEEETTHVIHPDSELLDQTRHVASSLLSLQQGLPQDTEFPRGALRTDNVSIPLPQPYSNQLDQLISTPDGSSDDGIFLPGSTYLELHSTLRNRLIQEVRSNEVTRLSSPNGLNLVEGVPCSSVAPTSSDLSDEHHPTDLPKKEEYKLWKNWLDEIAPWLDKFDNQRHFQYSLPIMARSHEHLRYAMLALSARQLERKDRNMPIERSLALYQQAIHLLLPQLHTRSTAAIASCVVLCVLEMLSCSPKAWRRHLDGCASLMEAVGINGFVGGVEQALFWCFARMDVCGGLISSVKTLIPVNHWASQSDLDADIGLFRSAATFEAHANQAVYLCAQVLDLLTSYPTVTRSTSFGGGEIDDMFVERWLKLWRYIDAWHAKRPPEMTAVMSMPSTSNSPFPTVLYSNPAAVSGNQLYHTASILMLQHKPPSIHLNQKSRPIFWHARQICAISISNDHHGAWTNSVQPLWIAGQWLSHPSEHAAILTLLERIETESGWGTKWRAQDLKRFWGDMEE